MIFFPQFNLFHHFLLKGAIWCQSDGPFCLFSSICNSASGRNKLLPYYKVGGVHSYVMHYQPMQRSKAVQFRRMQNSNKQCQCAKLSIGFIIISIALLYCNATVRHIAELGVFMQPCLAISSVWRSTCLFLHILMHLYTGCPPAAVSAILLAPAYTIIAFGLDTSGSKLVSPISLHVHSGAVRLHCCVVVTWVRCNWLVGRSPIVYMSGVIQQLLRNRCRWLQYILQRW